MQALRNVKGKVPKKLAKAFFANKTREVTYTGISLSSTNASFFTQSDDLYLIHNKHAVGYS